MNANGFGVKMYRIALNIIRKQFIPINLLQCEMRACCGRARLSSNGHKTIAFTASKLLQMNCCSTASSVLNASLFGCKLVSFECDKVNEAKSGRARIFAETIYR